VKFPGPTRHLQKGLNVFGSNVLAQCGSGGLGWSKPPCRSSTATHSVMHRRYALNSPGQEPKSRFFDSYVTVHINTFTSSTSTSMTVGRPSSAMRKRTADCLANERRAAGRYQEPTLFARMARRTRGLTGSRSSTHQRQDHAAAGGNPRARSSSRLKIDFQSRVS
jgi:hypothetical protein